MIVDGYVDEPTCLGVPPYVSTYPRYLAGAFWTFLPHLEIIYQTIDSVRSAPDVAVSTWSKSDMVVLIAGMIVPGKYLGGTPISPREARHLFSDSRLSQTTKVLVGPWARFGYALQGGRPACSPEDLAPLFDYVISGDAEIVIGNALSAGCSLENVDLTQVRSRPDETEQFALRGAEIVLQAPGFKIGHLICEIETFRGCPRYLTGGCSFCVEPLYGAPMQRAVEAVVREVERLYQVGVRAFRIGRQADLFVYGSKEMGEVEFPRPNAEAVEKLFLGIRRVAPDIHVLHIDNVNPGTLSRYPEESRDVARAIMRYHTTGDVAAFGVESADPDVIRRNNLKATPEEVLDAVRLLNEVGAKRPPHELPHLLPGLNFVYGLPGESNRTLEANANLLERILEEGLILRRINIRQLIAFPGTRVAQQRAGRISHSEFLSHKEYIRRNMDVVFLKRVAPPGTIIRSVFLESREGNYLLMRPLGSYPLLCQMPSHGNAPKTCDVFVVDHGPRSVSVLPCPIRAREMTLAQWSMIPGVGQKRAARLKREYPRSVQEAESIVGIRLPEWLTRWMVFE